ncbi:MAG: hypothetical protein K6E40_06365 [Desulfovibrio sp.]|nr:hypothetical protein [Desulfovibrio sp.]
MTAPQTAAGSLGHYCFSECALLEKLAKKIANNKTVFNQQSKYVVLEEKYSCRQRRNALTRPPLLLGGS